MRSKSFAPKTKPTVNDLVEILQSERRIFSCNELKQRLWGGDCKPQDLSILATEARELGYEMKYYHSVGWGMGFTPHPRELLIEAHLAIFNYILAHPDCRTRDVYRDLGLDSRWVRGELSISKSAMPARLKRAGASQIIDSYRDGFIRRWVVRNNLSQTQRFMLELLEEGRPISYEELFECLPVSEGMESLRWHIKAIRDIRSDLRIENIYEYGYAIPRDKGDLVGGEVNRDAIDFLKKKPRTLTELANHLWPWGKRDSAYDSAAVMKCKLKKSGAIFVEKGGRGRKTFHLVGFEPLEDVA